MKDHSVGVVTLTQFRDMFKGTCAKSLADHQARIDGHIEKHAAWVEEFNKNKSFRRKGYDL